MPSFPTPAPGLDDFNARPGSIASLLRTFVGLHLRRLGGWISAADLVSLLEESGAPATSVRSAVSRAKSKGLFESEKRDGKPGYALTPRVVAMLERGDDTIYSYRRHPVEQGWCLISYSVPEDRRSERYRVRRLLTQLGCGSVSDGLGIAPHALAPGLEAHLREAGLGDWVTIFDRAELGARDDLVAACSRWWDLHTTAGLHRDFIGENRRLRDSLQTEDTPTMTPHEAFTSHLRVVDSWRPIPYRDPGLAPEALPFDWPGDESTVLFRELSERLAPRASDYVDERIGQ